VAYQLGGPKVSGMRANSSLTSNREIMDSATKTNPSDVPHILTAREEKKVKRSIAKEATVAEKHVAQTGKALKSAENDEKKSEKVCPPIQVGRRHLFFRVY